MTEKPRDTDILSLLRRTEAELLSQLELVRKQIQEWEEHHAGSAHVVRPGEFTGLNPHQAILQYMRKAKKATRGQIVSAVIAGGLFESESRRKTKDPSKSVNQSIGTLVTNGKLEEPERGDPLRASPDSVILLVEK